MKLPRKFRQRTRIFLQIILLVLLVSSVTFADNAIEKVQKLVGEVVEKSYPELKNAKIEVKTFASESDYFRSQFSFSRFLTFRQMHYIVFVNRQVFEKNAPPEGVRSIIAHELAHVLYFKKHNRFELLGLVSLSSKNFTRQFERKADLEAVSRGYGEGLKLYRMWLYQNIPANKLNEKKRNYFSPEEIDLLLQKLNEKPELIEKWRKKAPRNAPEIATN